ncbi:hypothetical protein Lgra_0327 [Legionella gratiana]|uniref:Uncharacterized protein n=1 Tax=Legionella gratiana TaxID=45066 RepID=A0A378JBT8_9GAMM|nr:hypothetical protein [Legionella gratiana]KTD15661.1 hypothetical protein Lgra_0327 [Legionella gratiana]STX44806.1 Uncharacterised protein [Legionella gratiana]
MDDPFGDPNIIEDTKTHLSDGNTTSLEFDNQTGFTWDDYCDTDYNKVDNELQEQYGSSPSFYEVDHEDKESPSKFSGNDNINTVPWAGAKFLLKPIDFVAHFIADKFTALKQIHATNSKEATYNSSSQKIMISLSSSQNSFTNQDKILREANAPPDENGICSPMVNLYFEEQLGLRDASYREGSSEYIYKEARKEKQHQIDLIHQGKDGLHAVFVDHNIPYVKQEVDARKCESEEEVESLLKDYDQVLVTYPITQKNGEKDRHQIYIKKIDNSSCTRFDVNKEGGVEEIPCKMFYHKLAKKIAKAHIDKDNDDEHVIIAGIKKN